jgi:hypothetical protein
MDRCCRTESAKGIGSSERILTGIEGFSEGASQLEIGKGRINITAKRVINYKMQENL